MKLITINFTKDISLPYKTLSMGVFHLINNQLPNKIHCVLLAARQIKNLNEKNYWKEIDEVARL